MDKILNRAKGLYSDGYIISDSIKFKFNQMYLYFRPEWVEHNRDHIQLKKGEWVECDEATRSISLSDMIDSEGDIVFASLSEDGMGGDTFDAEPDPEDESLMATLIFKNGYRVLYDGWDATLPYPLLESRDLKDLKIIGVYRG